MTQEFYTVLKEDLFPQVYLKCH